jgi:Tfp pilus assembly protein PilF
LGTNAHDTLGLMNRCRVVVTLILTLHAAGSAQKQRTAFEYYEEGSRTFVEKRFDRAIEALKQSIALDPKRVGAVRLLGLSYVLIGQLDDAESQFRNACRLAPKSAEGWFYLGRLYYVRNFFDKAYDSLQTALKYDPNDARIHEVLALTHEAKGDSTAAEREYQQAMRLVQQPTTLLLNYGALLLKLNRPTESEPMLTRAAGEMPGFWQARFELAKLYYQTERFEAALRELKAALESSPKPDEASRTHGLMAVVYSRLGRQEEARRAATAIEK